MPLIRQITPEFCVNGPVLRGVEALHFELLLIEISNCFGSVQLRVEAEQRLPGLADGRPHLLGRAECVAREEELLVPGTGGEFGFIFPMGMLIMVFLILLLQFSLQLHDLILQLFLLQVDLNDVGS